MELAQPLNRYFDHAILNSAATEADIRRACAETRQHNFFGLAVNPCWNELVSELLAGSDSVLVAVAGFPLGATTTAAKIREALSGAAVGAVEVDMVANIGWLAANDTDKATDEINAIRRELPATVGLKVIIEAPLLNENQIRAACAAVIDGGAQFVKTATGFFGASTPEIAQLVIAEVAGQLPVKISGGIRTLAQAEEYIKLGAVRLGSSNSVAIMRELAARAVAQES
ncbi:MAG TPA: deoxyribose-phosphate aldolase [candidate division Zixibacteria bacterium]|nr:deoxyribose-phosphate aldolase [candidate division Zixibacteria bacterium]